MSNLPFASLHGVDYRLGYGVVPGSLKNTAFAVSGPRQWRDCLVEKKVGGVKAPLTLPCRTAAWS